MPKGDISGGNLHADGSSTSYTLKELKEDGIKSVIVDANEKQVPGFDLLIELGFIDNPSSTSASANLLNFLQSFDGKDKDTLADTFFKVGNADVGLLVDDATFNNIEDANSSRDTLVVQNLVSLGVDYLVKSVDHSQSIDLHQYLIDNA